MRRIVMVLLGLIGLSLPSLAVADIATCRQWNGLSTALRVTYVRGFTDALSLSEELQDISVVHQRIGTYVLEMTFICKDATTPEDTPLPVVFLKATQTFRSGIGR